MHLFFPGKNYILMIYMSAIKPDEATIEIIRRVFSPKIIEINHPPNINIIDLESDDICGLFVIYPDHIYIKRLDKCGSTSGTELLQMYDTLAQQMPSIKYIELEDASKIEICKQKINLYILKILTTGQSWYNSKGYFSKHYESERSHNETIINKQYEDFIDTVYKKNLELFTDENSIEGYKKHIERHKKIVDDLNNQSKRSRLYKFEESSKQNSEQKILEYQDKIDHYDDTLINNYIQEQEAEINIGIRLFPDANKRVKDYFNYVWRDITSNIREKVCDEETIEKFKWLSKFIDKIENIGILRYLFGSLIKIVIREESGKGGAKRKRSKTKKRRNKSKKRKSKKRKSKKSSK